MDSDGQVLLSGSGVCWSQGHHFHLFCVFAVLCCAVKQHEQHRVAVEISRERLRFRCASFAHSRLQGAGARWF